jgi:protein gp37
MNDQNRTISRSAPLQLHDARPLNASTVLVRFEPLLEDLGTIDVTGLDWAIAGAESDPWRRARPMQLDWVRHIRDQCIAAGVPFFFKQHAEQGGRKLPVPELDGRQWRQFPDCQ